MTQMRKFEQDAIVNQIMKTVKSKFEKKNETFKTKKEYQAIELTNKSIVDIEKRINILRQEKNILQTTKRESIQAFNNKFNTKLDTTYENGLEFDFNDWTIKSEVEDKLAISLLDSEWKDNLPSIMEEIANQF
jgi:hypothetical protein